MLHVYVSWWLRGLVVTCYVACWMLHVACCMFYGVWCGVWVCGLWSWADRAWNTEHRDTNLRQKHIEHRTQSTNTEHKNRAWNPRSWETGLGHRTWNLKAQGTEHKNTGARLGAWSLEAWARSSTDKSLSWEPGTLTQSLEPGAQSLGAHMHISWAWSTSTAGAQEPGDTDKHISRSLSMRHWEHGGHRSGSWEQTDLGTWSWDVGAWSLRLKLTNMKTGLEHRGP
jgi:hypothetical protein